MITIRKLEGLAAGTRGRKLLTLLAEEHDPAYDRALVRLALELLGESAQQATNGDRAKKVLRQRLASHLGLVVADWDLQAPPDRVGTVTQFAFHAWLDDLRSPFNVGSILRTAEAFGFATVSHSPLSPGLEQPRTRRTAMGADQYLPVSAFDLSAVKEWWGQRSVFALELGGTAIDEFRFPLEGLVLVGGEELGLSPEALAWADESAGRVSIPLYGRKASLNVGVAFGILAAAWTTSVHEQKNRPQ